MKKIILRSLDLDLPKGKSAFLWGPRQVGKSYWLRHHFPQAIYIDLLKSEDYADYASRPQLIRERYEGESKLIIIDEVQKIPSLLDEVHWMIANHGQSFILTGSSARKLRRGHANLLAGRAWRRTLVPLTRHEVEGFDLEAIMISGLLPPHFLSKKPQEDLRSYIADYLKEEIAAEAAVQNIPSFSQFLQVAAQSNGELINYTNVARESGVAAKVVRQYFEILEDTYLGFRLQAWRKSKKRRLIETEKFYWFDVGVSNYLAKRHPQIGNSDFGKSFEHYILMELMAYRAYRQPEMEISYWRTSTQLEVDFILNDKAVAIEVKASTKVHESDTRHLLALREDGPIGRSIVVSLEKKARRLDSKIEILPWEDFLKDLWGGRLV